MEDNVENGSMEQVIRNCSWGYKCQANWDDLTVTKDKRVRFCSDCQREVHSCKSRQELLDVITLNRCVRFPIRLVEGPPIIRRIKQDDESFVGMPAPTLAEMKKLSRDDSGR